MLNLYALTHNFKFFLIQKLNLIAGTQNFLRLIEVWDQQHILQIPV